MPYYPSKTDIHTLPRMQLELDSLMKQPETKADIVAYYQQVHGKSWKRDLVRDLSGFSGMKAKSLEKRFDPQRRENLEPRNRKQYEEFGKTLPAIPPKEGIRVTGTIYVKYSDDEEMRSINLLFQGEAAKAFASDKANHIAMILNRYQGSTSDGSLFQGPTFGLQPTDLGSWELDIQEG